VTNNSFVDQIAFDGMRKHLLKDFNQIYHLDLHGNVRKNPKLSGTTHNVFGIQVGMGITVAVRSSQNQIRTLLYYRVPEDWRKTEKLAFLAEKGSIVGIEWQELQPDEKYIYALCELVTGKENCSTLPFVSKDKQGAYSDARQSDSSHYPFYHSR
jgi:predicted helicase